LAGAGPAEVTYTVRKRLLECGPLSIAELDAVFASHQWLQLAAGVAMVGVSPATVRGSRACPSAFLNIRTMKTEDQKINGLSVDRWRDRIDAFQMHARTRSQQMRVVRVETIEVLSLGSYEMDRVQGPKEHRAIQPREQDTNLLEKRGCRLDQRPESPRHVMVELALQRLEHGEVDRAFAQLAVKSRGNLCHRDAGGCHGARAFGETADGVATRFVHIELRDKCGIEIGGARRRHGDGFNGRDRG
jgi:hypothetical protein